ncbi:alpha-L-rhamnosidase [Paenibacillus sp. strain BS8-2]
MHPVEVQRLRVEYVDRPLGIDIARPRLGWILHAEGRRGVEQSAYQILAASSTDLLAEHIGDLWDTGKIVSDESQQITYAGTKLVSGQRVYWKVRVWDEADIAGSWSEISSWSMGLLSRDEWGGCWIGLKSGLRPTREKPNPVVYLRRSVEAGNRVRRAVVYSTALGVYRLYVNGVKAGKALFAPEWTDYHVRTQYQTYDITSMLQEGTNTLSVMLGHGWYTGYLGMYGFQKYGMEPSFFLQGMIEYEDGTIQRVSSDESWLASFGPITSSDLQMGETYDARLEMPGWQGAEFDAEGWQSVHRMYDYRGSLVSQLVPPVAVTREHPISSIRSLPDGKLLVDVGQNLTGWLRFSVQEERDTTITLRYGEALDAEGRLYTENLRLAMQMDVFISNGGECRTYESTFTCHGFQYVEISGLTAPITVEQIQCIVVHSDLPESGMLRTSDPLVNKLIHNIRWSQRNNYMSVPTDCPQRDERHGWTGDAQIFARTAAYNMDISSFMSKWMTDLSDGQQPTGAYSDFAPFVFGPKTAYNNDFTYTHIGSAGWADAPLLIGWMLYEIYGDQDILHKHYASMKRWMDYNERLYPRGIRRDAPQYGDWLSVQERPFEELKSEFDWLVSNLSTTPYDVFSTMYWAYDTLLMTCIAGVLGHQEDEVYYQQLHRRVLDAFGEEFVSPDGLIKGDTQTVYAMALDFGLLEDPVIRQAAITRLVEKIKSNGRMATTGFHGTRSLMRALSDNGYEELAFELLLRKEYPSWLYSVIQGASTIWERWDGWTVEKGFQRAGMNSLCHYAFGSVGEWLYEHVGGISREPDSKGFRTARIRPRPLGGLHHADAEYDSLYGMISSSWKLEGEQFELEVRIPPNSQAYIHIPAAPNTSIFEGDVLAADAEGIREVGRGDGDTAVLLVSSGRYVFRSRIRV